jgi:flagellar biogenesis protein FliO
VIASIYGGIYLLKKMMGRRYVGAQNQCNLEVLETIHIAPRKTITLLRVGERSVLVGSTESSMSMLTELDGTETTKITQSIASETTPDNFGNFLKVAVDKIKEVTRKRHAAL